MPIFEEGKHDSCLDSDDEGPKATPVGAFFNSRTPGPSSMVLRQTDQPGKIILFDERMASTYLAMGDGNVIKWPHYYAFGRNIVRQAIQMVVPDKGSDDALLARCMVTMKQLSLEVQWNVADGYDHVVPGVCNGNCVIANKLRGQATKWASAANMVSKLHEHFDIKEIEQESWESKVTGFLHNDLKCMKEETIKNYSSCTKKFATWLDQ